jgi:hypothetical protein
VVRSVVTPAERHFGHHQRLVAMPAGVEIGPGDIELVIVHPDDPGQHALTGGVDNGIAGRRRIAARLDRGDAAMIDQHGPVLDRRRTGAVDHPHMRQRHARTVDPDERLDRIARRRRRRQDVRRHVELYRGRADQRARGQQHPDLSTHCMLPPIPAGERDSNRRERQSNKFGGDLRGCLARRRSLPVHR